MSVERLGSKPSAGLAFRAGVMSLAGAMAGCGSSAPPPVPAEKPAPTAACSNNRIEVRQALSAGDINIDWAYLDFLASPFSGERGKKQDLTLDGAVDYFLKKGFTALETDAPARVAPWRQDGYIARIAIWPVGSAQCMRNDYPLQYTPKLRQLGVQPEHCVGIERLSGTRAPVRIDVRQSDAFTSERFTLRRFDVTGTTSGTQPLQVVDHVGIYGGGSGKQYGGWVSICPDKNSAIAAVDAAIVGTGNPLVRKPQEIVVAPPEAAASAIDSGLAPVTQEKLEMLRWMETSDQYKRTNSLYSIDQRGEVWLESRREKGMDWAFHVVQPGRILVTPLPRESPRITYSTRAMARTDAGGYAVVVQLLQGTEIKNGGRLFEFDHDLRLTGAFLLTEEQVREAMVRAWR